MGPLNAARAKSLMEEKGWSQDELAKKLKVAKASISRWFSGSSQPRARKVVAMARVLGVKREELLLPEEK